MQVVAILSSKGGAGKTTLALHLAVAAEKAGHASGVIDLAPEASAARWARLRLDGMSPVLSMSPSQLAEALDLARGEGAGLVLIDTGSCSRDAACVAADAADVLLIVCRPSCLDLRSIDGVAELAQKAGKQSYVVLNVVPPRAAHVTADARDAIAAHGLEVAPITVQQRAVYTHALAAGQTAQEYEPAGKAADEMAQLYAWLRRVLPATHAKPARGKRGA